MRERRGSARRYLVYVIRDVSAMYGSGSVLHGFKALGSFEAMRFGVEKASERAAGLYKALGADVTNPEYVLGVLPNGRWALVGLPMEGQRYVVEEG